MKRATSLRQILSSDLCAGCGLCASTFDANITMRMTHDGFLRPVEIAELTEDDDGLLAKICPGIRLQLDNEESRHDPLWGPVHRVRIGAATDPTLRYKASSGGVLSALLNYLLERREVVKIVHTAASEISPIDNETVISKNAGEVYRASGSRYAPSSPLSTIHNHLNEGNLFALVGKPCDIAGARALARFDDRVTELIPYMLSFFCAGVPSRLGTKQLLQKMSVEEIDVSSFQYRGEGWPGYAKATTRDGKVSRMSYSDSWGQILSHYTQFRCKICPDGSGGFADVACADGWDCDDEGYPIFEEKDGLSLIVTRTSRGEVLVQKAIEAGYITASELQTKDIERMQPSQARRKKLVLSRLVAMWVCGRIPSFSGLQLREASRRATLFENVKSFLGMLRRITTKHPSNRR